jgi:hypothetical protein
MKRFIVQVHFANMVLKMYVWRSRKRQNNILHTWYMDIWATGRVHFLQKACKFTNSQIGASHKTTV